MNPTKKRIKHFTCLLLLCLLFTGAGSFAQDTSMVISPNQFLKYRPGYIVTVNNDTIRGLICHDQMDVVRYIKATSNLEVTPFRQQSEVTYSFPNKPVRAFIRNGMLYEAQAVPPDSNFLFLAVLVRGPMTLYALIGNYSDNGFERTIKEAGGLSRLSYSTNYNDEYYLVREYYIGKKPGQALVRLPHEEYKFNKVFVPLISDNKKFLRESKPIIYDIYHLRTLVELYNRTSPAERE